jgi:hypothetical protein
MCAFQLTDEQVADFERDGYLRVNRLFDDEETELLVNIARADREMTERFRSGRDTTGKRVDIVLHNDLRDDIYSAIV